MNREKKTIPMAPRPEKAESPQPPPFRPGTDYFLAVVLSWLIPGAGHWLLGHRVRAVILSGLLLGTFWWGEVMAMGFAVKRDEHPYFFIGQIGNGFSALLADRLVLAELPPRNPQQREIDRRIPPGLAMGIFLTSISGLLNILLILHVMDPRSWNGPPGEDGADPASSKERPAPPSGGPDRRGRGEKP